MLADLTRIHRTAGASWPRAVAVLAYHRLDWRSHRKRWGIRRYLAVEFLGWLLHPMGETWAQRRRRAARIHDRRRWRR